MKQRCLIAPPPVLFLSVCAFLQTARTVHSTAVLQSFKQVNQIFCAMFLFLYAPIIPFSWKPEVGRKWFQVPTRKKDGRVSPYNVILGHGQDTYSKSIGVECVCLCLHVPACVYALVSWPCQKMWHLMSRSYFWF